MEKHHKFSIWYIILGIWFVLILNNLIYGALGPTRISYSEFLDKLRTDQIKELSIGKELISGVMLNKTAARRCSSTPCGSARIWPRSWRGITSALGVKGNPLFCATCSPG